MCPRFASITSLHLLLAQQRWSHAKRLLGGRIFLFFFRLGMGEREEASGKVAGGVRFLFGKFMRGALSEEEMEAHKGWEDVCAVGGGGAEIPTNTLSASAMLSHAKKDWLWPCKQSGTMMDPAATTIVSIGRLLCSEEKREPKEHTTLLKYSLIRESAVSRARKRHMNMNS